MLTRIWSFIVIITALSMLGALPMEANAAWGVAEDLPIAGDFNRDGQGDRAVFRHSNRTWYFNYNFDESTDDRTSPWAFRGDLPIAGDFDRDGQRDDVAVFRHSNRTWYYDFNHDGTTDQRTAPWAFRGDLPIAGDFDRDGQYDDVAVFRPSNRTWYYDFNHDGTTDQRAGPWAFRGDLPIAGDFDRDGQYDDVAVYRVSNSTIYIDLDHNRSTDSTIGAAPAVGNCKPVVISESSGDQIWLYCDGDWYVKGDFRDPYSPSNTGGKFRIRDCPDNALVDLNWATKFIDRHLDSILTGQSILNTRYQTRIKDRWPKTTIDCATDSRNSCSTAIAFTGTANIVHFCWQNNLIVVPARNRCNIVATILHEKGHEAHVPDADAHNEGPSNLEVANDPVYQFGVYVNNYCAGVAGGAAAGTFNSFGLEPLGANEALPLGDYCDRNAQCLSNQCRWGECVCNDDGDCPSGHICDTVGRNECIRSQLALGANCDRNAQCLSGQCRRGECVCNDNGDCPSGYRCKTGGLNECIKKGGDIGEVCNLNSDCNTGKCDRDICVCDTNQDCINFFPGTDWRCRKGGQNECVRTNLPNGARCHINSDCQSGQCRGTGDGRTCR